MDTPLYNSSSTRTKKAMTRYTNKWGKINFYTPRRTILHRWMEETGMSEIQVLRQLRKERIYLIKILRGIDVKEI